MKSCKKNALTRALFLQQKEKPLFEVFHDVFAVWCCSAGEVSNHLAVFIQQELVEIPFDISI